MSEDNRSGPGWVVIFLVLLAVSTTIGCAVAVGFAVYTHNQNTENKRELERVKEKLEQDEKFSLNFNHVLGSEVENMSTDEYESFRRGLTREIRNKDRAVEIEALTYKSYYADWIGFGREIVLRHQPGPCRKIPGAVGGSEDLTILPNGLLFGSSGLFSQYQGSILLYDFNRPRNGIKKLQVVTGADSYFDETNFTPHGISSWVENGKIFLYVLNHALHSDCIEMFQYNERKEQLIHLRNFTSPDFTYMNDLVMVSKTSFYITKFFKSRDAARRKLETRLLTDMGQVMFYDGSKPPEMAATALIEHLIMPNGINISPDKRFVYVAHIGKRELKIYERNLQDNTLTEYGSVNAGTGIDNIEVDPNTGDLWIGCHPILHKIYEYADKGGMGISPSQVIRVIVRNGTVVDMMEVYLNDGTEISASCSASYYNGQVVVGPLADDHLVVCKTSDMG